MRAAFAVLVGMTFFGCGMEVLPRLNDGSGTVIVEEPLDPNMRGAFAPRPAVSGGTLIALRDGQHVIAADPDTDMVWKVRVNGGTPVGAALRIGDEPGRLVEDNGQRVHVALRRGNAIATIDVSGNPRVLVRRVACIEPRGIAFDSANDRVVVACADGQVVSFAAEGGEAMSRLQLAFDDLRDVAVVPGGFLISRFHSADLLSVDASGNVVNRTEQPPFELQEFGFDGGPGGQARTFTAGVAWRMTLAPQGALMTFQRGQTSTIALSGGISTGGPDGGFGSGGSPYGGGGGCGAGGVVQSELLTPMRSEPISLFGSLPVDVAANGTKVAVVMAADNMVIEMPLSPGGPPPPPGIDPACFDRMLQRPLPVPGQPVAVAIVGDTTVVQTRFPGGVMVATSLVQFPMQVPKDEGHTMFHAQTPAGLACASCHPEGRDDGRVWSFDRDGRRRTQTVAGGLMATAPFHWDGTLPTIDSLMNEVFVGRMGHPSVLPGQALALSKWLDTIPRPAARDADAAAAARGKELFEKSTVGCAGCHAGPMLTNNTSADVGTGHRFQVPSLVGIAARAPFMHDGCARTLEERFTVAACGGGDKHGVTSQLTPAEIADLVAYLKTL